MVPEGDGVVSVYLTGRRLDRLPAEAGQFLSWRFLDRAGWTRGNPYSLSAAPDGRSLRITVKELGDGSALDCAASARARRVLVEGPFGRLSDRARTRRRVALIGAGVGVTPLRALAEGLDYAPGDAVLLHRFTDAARSSPASSLVLARERGLARARLPGHRRADDSWLGAGVGARRRPDRPAGTWVPDIAERDVYVCGPDPWTDVVRRTAAPRPACPTDQVHVETFGW